MSTVTPQEIADSYTIDELASVLHMHRRTVERLIAARQIEVVRLSPRNTRITARAVTDYLSRSVVRVSR